MATKLSLFIGSLDRGGAETHIVRTFPHLHGEKFQIEVFCLSHRGLMAEEIEKSGIKIIEPWIGGASGSIAMELIRLPFLVLQLVLYFLFARPKIAHFFLPANYLIAGPLAWLCRVPIRIMSRRSLNDYQKKRPEIIRNIELWLHTKMHGILGNSQKVVQQLCEEEAVTPSQAHLIYNGIELPDPDTVRSKTEMREELGLSAETVVMTIVANLIPYKGHRDLLKACRDLTDQQEWQLLIVGKDSARIMDNLKELAEEYGIASKVSFLGPRPDVFDLLNASDIGLLVSHEEGFSNAVLEGMASSLPMVVTDVGGNGEAIFDGKQGYVVPKKSPKALTQALEKLLSKSDVREKMGAEAFERVSENFSMSACVSSYMTYYNELLRN